MKFVVIDKTFKDASDNPKSLPDDYPMDCLEVDADCIDEVEKKHPGKKVLSADHYSAYQDGCQVAQGAADKIVRLKSRGWWARLTNKDV
jgi:hypothetical protein